MRLKEEDGTWDIGNFQTSKATVLGTDKTPSPPTKPLEWSLEKWKSLRKLIGDSIYDSLTTCLRPELGATPDVDIARNVILYGPPGTGKTYMAKQVANALSATEETEDESYINLVQFHPSYAYEDFIQGIKPDLERKELSYALKPGPFMDVCDNAIEDPDNFYILVIDEINRGDPARIFGELLYSLEYRNQTVNLPSGGQLVAPSNLVIIGTMNSVDRSIAIADFAFRRRFSFVRLDPDPKVILKTRLSTGTNAAAQVLVNFNQWLTDRLDADHALGHSYFLDPRTGYEDPEKAFSFIWRLHVNPLLEEYFFGDLQSLGEARKRWDECLSIALGGSEDDDMEESDTDLE